MLLHCLALAYLLFHLLAHFWCEQLVNAYFTGNYLLNSFAATPLCPIHRGSTPCIRALSPHH